MQTNLEKKGIQARNEASVRNDYYKGEGREYSANHDDALSTGDVKGKGTGKGGHVHTIPDASKKPAIDYSKFDTSAAGGLYDIEGRNGIGGRNFLTNISLYNAENEYGGHMIDMSANLVDGQIIM